MNIDPEPDRDEAAARASTVWDTAAIVYPLLDQLDTVIDALGCKNDLHDWTAEFTGDPPDVPDRRLAWSRTRLVCCECGQTATLSYGERLASPPVSDVRKLVTIDEIADALVRGARGDNGLVQTRALAASLLWLAARRALGEISGDSGAAR